MQEGRKRKRVLPLPEAPCESKTELCGFFGFEEALELAHACGVTQLAQSFRLDLANAFAGHFILLAHFFERALIAIDKAEAEFQDAAFAFGEAAEVGVGGARDAA